MFTLKSYFSPNCSAAKCKPSFLRTPRNGRKTQRQMTDDDGQVTGWRVELTCNDGFVFYDQQQPLVYTCNEGEDFVNDKLGTYIPDCVGE